ncbi:hypothetical protein PFISCL1PPCAC_65, partial [Pristionchus fissidentatus]
TCQLSTCMVRVGMLNNDALRADPIDKNILEWALLGEYNADEEVKEELRIQKEKYAERRRRTAWIASIVFISFVIALSLFFYRGMQEQFKMRGMEFEARKHSLPLSLPSGRLQLRATTVLLGDKSGKEFSPYIASSQEKGRINILTNFTSPSYNAYTLEHPLIDNIVMITDEFFCSERTCFYLNDAHNASFFSEDSTLHFRDLSSQLIVVPLPVGARFIKAEFCSIIFWRSCSIVVEIERVLHYASLKNDEETRVPVFELTTRVPLDRFTGRAVVKAFNYASHRLIVWDDYKLSIIGLRNGRDDRRLAGTIKDVDYDEIVEVLEINKDLEIVLVMKENEGSTRVRIFAILPDKTVTRKDEYTVPAPAASISVLVHDNTFQICQLVNDELLCLYNSTS